MSSELREKINKLLIDFDKATRGNPYNSHHRKSTVTELEALIKEEKLKLLDALKADIDDMQPDPDYYAQAITSLRNKIEEE